MFEMSPIQLAVFTDTTHADGFVQIVPDIVKDDENTFKQWTEHTKAVLELVYEGFLNDITEQCSDFVERYKKETGREFRCYEPTAMAVNMFYNPTAKHLKWIN